jgi:hypothetical protein
MSNLKELIYQKKKKIHPRIKCSYKQLIRVKVKLTKNTSSKS